MILEMNRCSDRHLFKACYLFLLLTDSREKMKGPIRTVAFGSAALDAIILADDQRDR